MKPDELKTIRESLGLTKRALSQRLGVTPMAITHWETGARKIPKPIILLLAAIKVVRGGNQMADEEKIAPIARLLFNEFGNSPMPALDGNGNLWDGKTIKEEYIYKHPMLNARKDAVELLDAVHVIVKAMKWKVEIKKLIKLMKAAEVKIWDIDEQRKTSDNA